MGIDKSLHTMNLSQYTTWLEHDLVFGWMTVVEYLIEKHKFHNITVRHKKLSDGSNEDFHVKINTRNTDFSKVPNSIQSRQIVEQAGIAMGLLITQWLRPCSSIRVLMDGEGYDYRYLPVDGEDEELIEMTGTEISGGGNGRLNQKIKKFKTKHPLSSGYISVSCFPDKLQIHWGHRN